MSSGEGNINNNKEREVLFTTKVNTMKVCFQILTNTSKKAKVNILHEKFERIISLIKLGSNCSHLFCKNWLDLFS